MTFRVAIGPSSFAEQDKTPLEMLESAGCEVVPNPFGRRLTENETVEHLREVDGLIAGLEPLNRTVLESAPRLKAIARVGIGMTNVDSEAARERGIKVSNTPDGPVEAVAEMTVAALLALSRQLIPSNDALHGGEWKKIIGRGMRETTLLVVGYGRIGRRVAQLLQAFGVRLLIYDPYLDDSSNMIAGHSVESLEEGLQQANAVSLHASGEKVILDAQAFQWMQAGTILLNSARGELVDESALMRALDAGKVTGAWFDAFREEPYKGPLTQYPQVLLTPHVGTYTKLCRREMETAAVQHLLRDLGVTQAAAE